MNDHSVEMHVNEMRVIWIQVTLLAFAQISNFISETEGKMAGRRAQIWCMTKDLDDEGGLMLRCFGAVLGLFWEKERRKK